MTKLSRTRIFEAVRKQELTILKVGRASIVTHASWGACKQ